MTPPLGQGSLLLGYPYVDGLVIRVSKDGCTSETSDHVNLSPNRHVVDAVAGVHTIPKGAPRALVFVLEARPARFERSL